MVKQLLVLLMVAATLLTSNLSAFGSELAGQPDQSSDPQFSPEVLKKINARPSQGNSYIYTSHLDGGSAHTALVIVISTNSALKEGGIPTFHVYCSNHLYCDDQLIAPEAVIVALDPGTQMPEKWKFKFTQEFNNDLTRIVSDSNMGDSLYSRKQLGVGDLALVTDIKGNKGTWRMISADTPTRLQNP